jgi:GH15 family glucan-1,4-alpha-glucosidase
MDLRQRSIEIIKRNQSPSGAYVASPTFSQYGYSWFRDGMWIAHSMDCVGEHDSARAFHQWAAGTLLRYESHVNDLLEKLKTGEIIEDKDYLPTRFTVNGDMSEEDWTDFQLDGYGAWLWGAVQHCKRHDPTLWVKLRPAVVLLVRYLAAIWDFPNYDCWEEFRQHIHISTLAAIYGGLTAVQDYESGIVPDDLPSVIHTFIHRNGVAAEGHFMKFVGNPDVDASLLWVAVPFDVVDAHDPHFLKTLEKIESDLHYSAGGVYRYKADTYYGGGEWLLLACWLAWAYIRLDRVAEARRLLEWVEHQTGANGEMPEQVSQHLLDESLYQPWIDRWGAPACPLLWSHAMYLIIHDALEKI